MADNVAITEGSGTTISADDIAGVKVQRVKVQYGGDGSATDVDTGTPLPVTVSGVATSAKQDTGNTSLASIDGKITAVNTGAVVVSSSALPSGAATSAAQTDKSQFTKLTDGTDTAQITAAGEQNVLASNLPTAVDTNSGLKSASTLRVVLATDQPALTNKLLVTPDSVALPANQSVNNAQINGITPLMGNGVTGTGSQRVTVASDNTPFPVKTDQTTHGTTDLVAADNTKVAGTAIDVNSGLKSAGTMRVVLATDQPALTNKLLVTPDSVALPANQSVNNAQINGVTPLMGNGASGTGAQRVTIANDSTGILATVTTVGTVTTLTGTTTLTPGTGATNLGKAEDAAHTSADVGVFVLGVRNDGAATSFSGTNGDYTPIGVDAAGTVSVAQKAATGTLTNVASSATNVTLLAANSARKAATIYNDSTQVCYVKFGATASATSFTVPLLTNTYYEVPGGYTGIIDGIWASANGNARVTEIT